MTHISFRPLERSDLPALTRWLNTPHVFEWWGVRSGSDGTLGGAGADAATLAAVEAEYGPEMDAGGPAHHFVIALDGAPSGLIQWYRLADCADYAADIGERTDGSAGMDLLIGETAAVGRGLGPWVIDAFVRTIVFADDAIHRCVAGPEIGNGRSIRAFEKAGFRIVRDAQVTGEGTLERIVARDRIASDSLDVR
ncbi:MAG: GNAT family N-acetyltransferase [Acidimicrobiia bacterium]